MTAPVFLMAGVIAVSMPGQRWPALRRLPVYLLTDRPISLILYAYALANVHNVSWGTKGLIHDPRGHSAEERRMRRLRDIIGGSIVAVTAMLVAVGSEYPGVWVKSESSVVEAFTLLFLVVTSVAAATWAYSVGRSLHALSRPVVAPLPDNRARKPSPAGSLALAPTTRDG
jgi:hypothetical protein